MRLLQSLTARVIIGLLILAATAAGLFIATTANQDRLNQEIRVIRTGYLRLALRTRDLAEKQSGLVDYLRDDLVGESNVRRVAGRIERARDTRQRLLEAIDEALADQTDAPKSHEKRLAESRSRLEAVKALIVETEPLYTALLAAPPIERITNDDATTVDPDELAAATEALKQLQRSEGRIHSRARELARYQQRLVELIAKGLERGSSELRKYSIMFLVAAVVVGMIVILWTSLTLGPLRRLPIAAQRIAEGDYAARIPERGPTEVVVLAREFNQMAEAIEDREREIVRNERLDSIGKVAASITHEVRNPLSAISLNMSILEEDLAKLDDDDVGETRSLCSAINTEIDRLTEITETYLQFARVPQPRMHPEDLGELVRSTTRFLTEQMNKAGVEFETHIEDNLPTVELDHAQIKQALLNLLRNAAEALAATEEPKLTVNVRHRSDGVVIEVKDNGPGIPADVLPRLFEAFFTTKKSGTGVGLALSQQIVQEHGGTLTVESKAGSGATFFLTLPVVSAPSLLGG